MRYNDLYELMRAYRDSNLLVNKLYCGARVSSFISIPSYRQIIRDATGKESYYQYFEFKLPFYIKREKAVERFFKRTETLFSGVILPVSDEEIESFNTYWELPFIGLTQEFLPFSSSMIIRPDGSRYYFSLVEGKELSDVFQIFFKPIPFSGGAI